jgi:hypothetical protein
MIVVVVLFGSWLILRGIGALGVPALATWHDSVRYALAVMFVFTGAAHFNKMSLDVADEQPEGTIFIIPVRLDECDVPDRLRRWHWVRLFDANGFGKLMTALEQRASELGIKLGTRLPGPNDLP